MQNARMLTRLARIETEEKISVSRIIFLAHRELRESV